MGWGEGVVFFWCGGVFFFGALVFCFFPGWGERERLALASYHLTLPEAMQCKREGQHCIFVYDRMSIQRSWIVEKGRRGKDGGKALARGGGLWGGEGQVR